MQCTSRDSTFFQVNLQPSEVPRDVYTGVADVVEELRKKDADSGIKIAEDLKGYVSRKVVKQTVMTTVYGVTRCERFEKSSVFSR